ncbi:MAG: NAD-dependent deacylase [Kordiimonadaceae bacterium]|jgi:NAD-dependent deacetylase|nr:NAD-dependent deacylase [Kordiimonadaceae bacterium]MBT6037425.1 NAD-dependent deacylase [Kordiimonadaceae bacterium]MBT6329931.1 NAD-dependent deacylase [Kordiimonadaceae bacterium]MBT7582209.1 NAD-dependent deacylase [Kordiimonadaceae bacterium]
MKDFPKTSPDAPIVILTGAGISKESGLATFRGEGGLWQGVSIEQVASPDAFKENPKLVHSFYNKRKEGLLSKDISPNDAHLALARLERDWLDDVTIITQNVDNLHERAGSENLIHMHGELLKARCVSCDEIFQWQDAMDEGSICPHCAELGSMRVDVVWFGEMPLYMAEIEKLLMECGLFISIGTSGNVYPAAGFVDMVTHYNRAKTVELNIEPSLNADQFSNGYYGPATKIVPDFVDKLLGT